MRIIQLDHSGGLLIRTLQRLRDREQARVGLHCGSICDDYIKTLYPEKYRGVFTTAQMLLFQTLGVTLEDMLARELRRVLGWEKPAPRQDEHGIWCSPDGWNERTRCIDEVKLTWVSSREFLSSPKFMRYVLQILKYMREWEAERARLHVVWVAGNYRPPFPDAATFVLKPTRDEREDNHSKLVQHAKDREWL